MELLETSHATKAMHQKNFNCLIYLMHEGNDKAKGLRCTNRRKHEAYVKTEDIVAPTVALLVLMLTCFWDAIEHRTVTTADTP